MMSSVSVWGKIKTVIILLNEHIDNIFGVVSDGHRTKLDVYRKELKILDARAIKESGDDKIKEVHEVYEVLHLFETITKYLTKINSDYSNYGSEKSMSFILEISGFYNKLKQKISLLERKINDDLQMDVDKYSGVAVGEILRSDDPLAEVQKLNQAFHKYPYSISLYKKIIKSVLSKVFYTKPDLAKNIGEIIEADKTKVLNVSDPIVKQKYNNPPMKSFGFVPRGLSSNLAELFDRVGVKVSGKTDAFARIAEQNKINIICLNHVTPNPVENYIDPLTKLSEAKKFNQPQLASMGVTFGTTQRHKTILRLGKGQWRFDGKIYMSGKDFNESKKTLVIENLAVGHYRIMSPWAEGDLYTPNDRASTLVEFIKAKYQVTNASRVYNANQQEAVSVLQNIFTTKPVDMDLIELETQAIEYKFLRHSVYVNIMKHYDGEKKIKTLSEFEKRIHSPEYIDILIHTIIDEYLIYAKEQNLTSTFGKAEIIITFLSQLSDITRTFSRELHDYYVKDTIDESDIGRIKEKFADILEKTLSKTINDNTNVYQAMIQKHKKLAWG